MNKQRLTILAAELAKSDYADYGQDYPAIAAALNERPSIANPTPQGTIPKPLNLHVILGAIATTDAAAVPGLVQAHGPILDRIDRALADNNREATSDYFFIISSGLNDAAKTAVQTLLAQTEPDPSWQSTVAGDSVATTLGLPVVSEMDVQLCLHPELWSGD